MQRVVIAGYYGFGNVGDEAVLEAMLHGLRSSLPRARFCVTSDRPDLTAAAHSVEAVDWRDLSAVADHLAEADLVLVGGGGLLNSYLEYSHDLLLTQGHSLFSVFVNSIPILARIMHKPCMLYSVGADRFLNEAARQDAYWTVEASAVACVRDEGSREILASLGCRPERIHVAADPAFTIANASSEAVNAIWQHEGLPEQSPLICVVLRNWPFAGEANTTERSVAEVLARFCGLHGGAIVFIPFDSNASLGELSDDRTVISRVMARLEGKAPAVVLRGEYRPGEISGIIRRCDFVLGMRVHSLILAIRNSVPCAALAYAPKVWSLMREAELEDLTLDIREVSPEGLFSLMDGIFRERGRVRERLEAVARRMAERAPTAARLALKLLEDKGADDTSPGWTQMIEGLLLRQTKNVLALERQTVALMNVVRRLVGSARYEQAEYLLDALLDEAADHPEGNYLKAFCLHMIGLNADEALSRYTTALHNGYAPFWVLYNRGSLLASLSRLDEALADLRRAHELDPGHEGAAAVLADINARVGRLGSTCREA